MEFVSRSRFWSFNPKFQFNGAEAALVFLFLNVHLLVLYSASVCSTNRSNQTCRILGMQLPPPPWGIAKMRNLFPPASPVGGRACRVPCRKLLLPQQLLLLHPPEKAAWQGRSRQALENPPAQHPDSVPCVSATQLRMGLVFHAACLDNCGATPELPHVQLLFYIKLPSNQCCLTIQKKKNLSSVSSNVPNFSNFGVTKHKIFNL